MIKIINLIVLVLSSVLSFFSSHESFNKNMLVEQSCFAGYYVQNRTYGDGDSVQAGPYVSGVVSFNLNTRDYVDENDCTYDELIENGFYSRDFHDYEFVNYSESKYQSIVTENGMNGPMWGPKDSSGNSLNLTKDLFPGRVIEIVAVHRYRND